MRPEGRERGCIPSNTFPRPVAPGPRAQRGRATIALLLVAPSRGCGGGGERPAFRGGYPRGEAEPPHHHETSVAILECGCPRRATGRRAEDAAQRSRSDRRPVVCAAFPRFPRRNTVKAQRRPHPFAAVGLSAVQNLSHTCTAYRRSLTEYLSCAFRCDLSQGVMCLPGKMETRPRFGLGFELPE